MTLLDLAPTILEAAGVPAPASFTGWSLSRVRSENADRVAFAESPPYDVLAVWRGRHKLIERPDAVQIRWESGQTLDKVPYEECFDLAADPGEHSSSCGEPWADELRRDADRHLAAGYPGALVLRVAGAPGEKGATPCRIEAAGVDVAPEIVSRAIRPVRGVTTSGAASALEFPRMSSVVWVAVIAREASRSLLVRTRGCGPLASPSGEALAGDSTRPWAALLWRRDTPLPSGSVLLTQAPEETARVGHVAMPDDLAARLRSLGYLSSPITEKP